MPHGRPVFDWCIFMLFGPFAVADHLVIHVDDGALLDGYHTIQTAFAKDEFDVAAKGSKDLVVLAEHWISEAGGEHPQLSNVKGIQKGAEAVVDATTEEEYRVNIGILSEGVVEFIRTDASEPRLKSLWNLYRCPMAPAYKFWVQPKTETKKMNLYMGLSMQQCGSLKPW